MCKEYNGWSNYETWNVGLWIGNDEGNYDYMRFLVNNAKDVYELEDTLKAWICDDHPLVNDASLYSDLLGAALSSVDWYELAKSFWVDERDDSEDDSEDE